MNSTLPDGVSVWQAGSARLLAGKLDDPDLSGAPYAALHRELDRLMGSLEVPADDDPVVVAQDAVEAKRASSAS